MGGIVGGLFGQSTPSAPNLTTWQPANVTGADNQFYNTVSNDLSTNPYTANANNYAELYYSTTNNPYYNSGQAAATQAQNAYGAQGNADMITASNLNSAIPQDLSYANQVMQQALDPNQALFQRTQQQLIDQSNANNAASGVSSSGYGADLTNEALGNFDINWNTQQLNNALAGLSGYNSAVSNAGQTGVQANQIGAAGAQQLGASGQQQYNLYNQQQGLNLGSLNALTGAGASGQSLNNSSLSQLMSYLGLGAQQSNNQAQLNNTNYQNQLAASQASQQGLGNLFNGAVGAASNLYNSYNSGAGFIPSALSFLGG